MDPHCFWHSIPLVAVLLLSGCGPLSQHADEHLEHHTPAHKPASLSAAIDDVDRRYRQLADSRQVTHAEQVTQLSEFIDIVRWLPELAGDSDMSEKDWNVVDGISESLLPRLHDQLSQLERGSNTHLQPLSGNFTASLEQLRNVASKLPKSPKTSHLGGVGSEHD